MVFQGAQTGGEETTDLSEVQLYIPLYISLTKGCNELLRCRSETMHRCKGKAVILFQNGNLSCHYFGFSFPQSLLPCTYIFSLLGLRVLSSLRKLCQVSPFSFHVFGQRDQQISLLVFPPQGFYLQWRPKDLIFKGHPCNDSYCLTQLLQDTKEITP